MIVLAATALATTRFDPTTPARVFTGRETWDADQTVQLWSRIERLRDPDAALFTEESFNSATEWADSSDYAPWIGDCFGTGTPDSGTFLLHVGPNLAASSGTPILFVPGAGDNGSRGFVTMASHMDQAGRPVFALTFAHPHGDVFEQAEVVTDAIARVREITGAAQVDVVSHSKGGIAVAVALSHHAGASWGNDAYEAEGTPYRGDVRRAVFIATPLGGIDTAYRWPLGNSASLAADTALAPSSWRTWYPYGSGAPAWATDLAEQDFLPDGGDLFPGQRQLLARQDFDLPGSLPWLGAYALQPDWYTTYEGGVGYQSYSDGIDAAIDAGGDLIDRLADVGVDPDVELYVLAGENPLMPNGTENLLESWFGDTWVDLAGAGVDTWAALVADAVGDGLLSVGIADDEVQGLASGDLILGEISGPSDGLVFVDSATAGDRLGARGATVRETYVANLSHLDLLYASPITGQLLVDAAEADPLDDRWMAAVGERYIEADTIGWVERVLADDATPDTGDTGVATDDSGSTGDDTAVEDSGAPDDDSGGAHAGDSEDTGASAEEGGCSGGCATGGGELAWSGIALAGWGVRRRRRRAG